MAVTTFYRGASAYTSVNIVELGEISSGSSTYVESFQNRTNMDVNVPLNGYMNPDDYSGTHLNFISSDGSATGYYSTSNLINGFIATGYVNATTGYRTFQLILNNTQVAVCSLSYEDYVPTYRPSIGYLALATVSGVLRLGFLAINDRSPSSNNYRKWNAFVTNAAWSDKMLEELKIVYPDPENPYDGAGASEEGGGNSTRQNWDNASDPITPDALPTKGAINSGMLKVFSPSETQVLDLTDLLFSYNFFDWLQKNLQNLEELFVSFGVVPFTVTKGATKSVTFLGFDISTFAHPVYLTEASQQYYEFDMGSIALNGSDARIHASDSVFDYSPFSRLGIYLPFIGFQELDIDECRGNTINLKYRIDIISGSAVALIYLNSDEEHCIYQFSGNCLSQIPLGSVDMSGIIAGSINIAVAAASAGVSGAIASAGDALTAENLNAGKITETAAGLQNSQHAAQVSHGAGTLASATANGIMGMKPNFKHTGAIGSTGGLMAVKQPYLFLTTPREAVPSRYQRYCGLPSNITDKLENFSGYTVVEDIRLNGLVATSTEVEEIYNLLKSGVII